MNNAFGPHDRDYNPWKDAESKSINVKMTYQQNYLGVTRHGKWYVSIYLGGRKNYTVNSLIEACDIFDGAN